MFIWYCGFEHVSKIHVNSGLDARHLLGLETLHPDSFEGLHDA